MLTGEYGTGTGARVVSVCSISRSCEIVKAHAIDCVYLNKVDCLAHYFHSTYQGVPMRVNRDVLSSDVMPDVLIYPGLSEHSLTLGREGKLDAAMHGFVDFVERQIGAPLAGIGLGPERASLVSLSAHQPALVVAAFPHV